MEKTPMLKVENARYSYTKGQAIFSDINFSLEKGEIFTILGPNGVGKSTLLNCLGNLLTLERGKIFVDGNEMSKLQRFLYKNQKLFYLMSQQIT